MARTKQTARKSTGGKAPRSQLSANGSHQVKQYFQQQQSTGKSKENSKKIFVNCENTFSQFSFARQVTQEDFQPQATLGRIYSEEKKSDELYMRMDFISNLDGKSENVALRRPALDAVFMLDVSGSMSLAFKNDPDSRSKLEVAKECLIRIAEGLSENDRIGVGTFQSSAEIVLDLEYTTPKFLEKLKKKLKGITSEGGTDLSGGLTQGYELIREQGIAVDANNRNRMHRVFFLTDMESGINDELNVIRIATKETKTTQEVESIIPRITRSVANAMISVVKKVSNRKRKSQIEKIDEEEEEEKVEDRNNRGFDGPAYLSVIGIGVDLSIDTVERISSVVGAKYMSVVSSSELHSTVCEDFHFDVTPIAFNVNVEMPQGIIIEKVFGSAELNNVTNAQIINLSSEFPVPLDDNNFTSGGIYLLKLKQTDQYSPENHMTVKWTDRDGVDHTCEVNVVAPPSLVDGELFSADCDGGLRKAVSLKNYVNLLTEYVTGSDNDNNNNNDDDDYEDEEEESDEEQQQQARQARLNKKSKKPKVGVSPELAKLLNGIQLESVLSIDELPEELPLLLKSHFKNVFQFKQLLNELYRVMEACGDNSLDTNNKNIVQTLLQIIDVETKEIKEFLATSNQEVPIISAEHPRGFVCPITLELMTDPVVAADGHSYEREAIVNWLKSNNVSPVTNLELEHKIVTSNYALRAAVQDYKEKLNNNKT